MRVTIRRTTDERITLDGSPDEIRQALAGVDVSVSLPEPDLDPQTLSLRSPGRYRLTGRTGDYGEREAIDVRTDQRGVFVLENMGGGFVPGARVTDSGRVEFAHPSDNPLQGWRI